jgi:hypothetical protein
MHLPNHCTHSAEVCAVLPRLFLHENQLTSAVYIPPSVRFLFLPSLPNHFLYLFKKVHLRILHMFCRQNVFTVSQFRQKCSLSNISKKPSREKKLHIHIKQIFERTLSVQAPAITSFFLV